MQRCASLTSCGWCQTGQPGDRVVALVAVVGRAGRSADRLAGGHRQRRHRRERDPEPAEGAEVPAPDLALPQDAADHRRADEREKEDPGRKWVLRHVEELLRPQDEYETGGGEPASGAKDPRRRGSIEGEPPLDCAAATGERADGAPHGADEEEETEDRRFPEHPDEIVGRSAADRSAGDKTDDGHGDEERRHAGSGDPQTAAGHEPADQPEAADVEADGAFVVESREDVLGSDLIAVGNPCRELDHRAQLGDVAVAVLERDQGLSRPMAVRRSRLLWSIS